MGLIEARHALLYPAGHIRFEPCYKLRAAWEVSFEEWYDDCILDILALPPMEITEDDVRDLGHEVAGEITANRLRVAQHRLALVPSIPEVVHHSECPDRKRCSNDWAFVYSAAMTFIAHMKRFYTGREVFEKFKEIESPLIYEKCRRRTFARIGNRGFLWKEEEIISEGAEIIKRILIASRPTNPRPPPRYFNVKDRGTRTGFYVAWPPVAPGRRNKNHV